MTAPIERSPMVQTAQPASAKPMDVLERLKSGWEKITQSPNADYGAFAALLSDLDDADGPGCGLAKPVMQDAVECLRQSAVKTVPIAFGIGIAQILLLLEDNRGGILAPEAAGLRLHAALEQMRALLGGQSSKTPLGSPIPHDETPDHSVLIQLGRGLTLDLQRIKLALSALERRNAPGAESQKAVAALAHIGAALEIARLHRGAGYARHLLADLKPWADGSVQPSPAELVQAMQILEELSRFAQRLEDNRPDPEGDLPVLEAVETGVSTSAAAPSDNGKSEPAPVDTANDPEILEIYVEEISEWLQTTNDLLTELRRRPNDQNALADLRKAFHTLKGTSRVAGYAHLGNFAWDVEELLNDWHGAARPATQSLLAFTADVRDRVGHWLTQLQTNRRMEIAAPDLMDRLDLLATGEAGAEPPESLPAAAEPQAAPDVVNLDGRSSVSRALFDIFIKEAENHLEALGTALHEEASAPASFHLVRTAHTLAGISRTVGATPLADLAHGLEKLLQSRHEANVALNADDRRGFERTLRRLTAFFAAVREGKLPAPDDTLVALLHKAAAALIKPAEAQSPPSPPSHAATALAAPLIDPQLLEQAGVDPEMGSIFLEEANALAGELAENLHAWRSDPDAAVQSENVIRLLHTLKGSARSAGFLPVGEIVHQVESLLLERLDQNRLDADFLNGLQNTFDQWCSVFEHSGSASLVETEAAESELLFPLEEDEAFDTPSPIPEAQAGPSTQLRVPTSVLERLLDTSAEISLTRSRVAAELDAAMRAAADMEERVKHLRDQLREIEIQAESQMHARFDGLDPGESSFDPLEFDRYTRLQELTRIMAESLYDLTAVQYSMRRHFSEGEGILGMQARLQRNLHSDLMHIRTAPFDTVVERLRRIVRQTAAELGRRVELSISGGHLELDRTMLDRLISPLEHMIRNAIAHGIEAPEQRRAAGKPETGSLRIALQQEVNTIRLNVSDDGSGIDLAKVRQRAVNLGLVGEDEEVDDDRLRSLIFRPGFSTAAQLTEVAGRGVGTDVVLNTIHNMGGDVHVRSTAGEGTTFSLSLPLTLVVAQAVVVYCGDRVYGIPANLIAQVQRCNAATLMSMLAIGEADWNGERYPFRYLGDLFGMEALESALKRNNIVLYLRTAHDRLAIQVDSIAANQEFALKELGPQLAGAAGIVGATISHDGRPLLLINPLQMTGRRNARLDMGGLEGATRVSATPLVMIADDSVTVRKVTSRLLERSGYRVVAVKDGVEAVEKMRDEVPAMFLLDIEMPRMDGFELTKHIREDPRCEDKPIIVISSRTAEKHRQKAYELGVTLFLGKPYQDVELLRQIERLGHASRIKSAANYEERRKYPRKRPRQILEVHDSLSRKAVGKVVNVSVSGFMLQTAERFRTNRVYHMELNLPGPLNGGQPLRLVTESMWLESSFEDGQFWVGFQFIQPDEHGTKVLNSLVTTYCV